MNPLTEAMNAAADAARLGILAVIVIVVIFVIGYLLLSRA